MAGAIVSASVGVLNPLLTKLSSLIEGEYNLLKSVKKDIIFLRNELSSISVLLEHLSNKEDKLDGPTMEWRNNMLELAYDIEDCIDLFIHKLSCGDANANFVRKIGSKIKKLWGKHQITECIQELKNRVMEEDQRRKRYQIDDFISEPSMVEIDPRLPALYEEVERLVGIDGPREKIVKWIMHKDWSSEQRKVVSIVGWVGRSSMSDATADAEDCSAKSLMPESKKEEGKGEMGGVVRSFSTQFAEFEVNSASNLPKIPLYVYEIHKTNLKKGKMAFSIPFSEQYINEHLPIEDLLVTVVGSTVSYPMRLMKSKDKQANFTTGWNKLVGDKLFELCDVCVFMFNPFTYRKAKLVMTGMFSCITNTESYLRAHCNNSYSHHIITVNERTKSSKSSRQDLIWRWIAEGFIVEVKNQTQEQVGENYFNELINRSLIQPVSIQYDGSAKYCRVHDIVLDLIISLSTGQNFVAIVDEQQHWSSFKKIRRTWFPSNGTDNRIVKKITNNCSQVRSLLFFENPKPKQIPQFKKCHALRLKYLKVFGVNVTELPKDIGRLQQLETLTIHAGDVDEINIPSSVCRLQKLQRLNFNYPMRLPDGIGVLQALEVLYLDSIRYSIKCLQELCWLTRLRQLRILCPGIYDFGGDVARFQRYKEAFYFTLNELGKNSLRSLHVTCSPEFSDTLMDSCCSSAPDLKELFIDGNGISKFSDRMILPLFVSGILQALIRKWSSSLGIPKLLYLEVFLSRGLGDGLTRLCFSLYAREAASNLGLEQSYVHLSSLQHLTFYLCCTNATITDVKAAEAAIRNVISIHTRRPTLVLRRYLQDRMVKEDEEEQLKDSTDGCGVEEHHIQ
uniref:Uncharacterized protein n=1 Tax=Oryza nivara TaxID=4536 RepID=A0A0E0J8S2_ORYNI